MPKAVYVDHSGIQVWSYPTKDSLGKELPEGHCYEVRLPNADGPSVVDLMFQRGPIPMHGINGLTNEVLLAVLIDRTKYLNSVFPCSENDEAIECMTEALQAFESRTKNRVARGVEGQHKS